MKEKKILVMWTLGITVGSFVAAVVFFFIDMVFLYNVFLAVFGSSILGGVVSLIEYFSSKRRSMENYWQAVYDFERLLYKIPYYDFSKEKIADDAIENSVNAYLKINHYGLKRIVNTYSALDFICAQKAKQKAAQLLEIVKECYYSINEEAIRFKMLLDDNYEYIVVNKLKSLNAFIFREEIYQNNGLTEKKIYPQKLYEIDKLLEEYRCEIYNCDPETLEERPIDSTIIDIKDNYE